MPSFMNLATGNRVILITRRHGESNSNPVWDGEYGKVIGTITSVMGDPDMGDLPIHVEWDNHSSNQYDYDDLELYNETKSIPVLADGKARTIAQFFAKIERGL